VHLHGRDAERDMVVYGLGVEARGGEEEEPDQGKTDVAQVAVLVEDDSEW
jgi:hypothetical protein